MQKENSASQKKWFQKVFTVRNIVFGVFMLLSITAGFLIAKAQITMKQSLNHINRDVDTSFSSVDLSGIEVSSDDDIVNILLIGNDYRIEKNGWESPGYPDVMIIGTMDLKHGTLKLTSLMRDTLVYIPDADTYTRLNESMQYGVEGLYKTIAHNFNIKLDGYVEVGFDAFEEVVNSVGGVEVELTDTEVRYLEQTNYIRKKRFRKGLKVGKQTLNGAQALGYCRIRKGYDVIGESVVTANGLIDDYGRTWRQRTVISQAFSKMKTMPISTWIDIANKVLGKITTDLNDKQIMSYMKSVVMMGTTEIHQLQVPVNGYFWANKKGEVYEECFLIPNDGVSRELNLEDNSAALNQFIFEFDGEGEFEYKPEVDN